MENTDSDTTFSGEQRASTDTAQGPGDPLRPAAPEDLLAKNALAEEAPEGGEESAEEEAGDAALRGDVDELMDMAAQRDEYLALAQRTQADFENYRKRVARDAAAAQQRGVVKLARELLPALDNLDRALEAAAEEDPLLEGVRLVRAELASALARVGIESFSPDGERFDPAEHEAMAQRPVDGADSGTVVEVYQSGYRLGENIIRPARVLVAA
jgi:molecular chaperone GrpE